LKFPKIEVAYTIAFNNTGLEWTDIQDSICDLIEKKYSILHMIGDKYFEKLDVGANYIVIKNTPCNLYFRVHDLQVEVVAVKTEFQDKDNRKWNTMPPVSSRRELYLVTINRKSDNCTWVQDMIWDGYSEKWLWRDDPEDCYVSEDNFTIRAWQMMPEPMTEN